MVEQRRDRQRALRWVEEGTCRRAHLLHAGADVLARLERTAAATTRVDAHGRNLTLCRVGFVRPRVVLRPEGEIAEIASFVPDPLSGDGTIAFSDGTSFALERVSWSGGECLVRDVDGRQVLHVQREMEGGRCGAALTAEPRLGHERALELACLCWHVLLLELDDPNRPVTWYIGPERRRSPRALIG